MKSKSYILTLLTIACAAGSVSANPADLNKDKSISWEEFLTLKTKQAKENGKEPDEKELKFLFADKDRNGDGVLSYKEFGAHPYDLDGDKSISFDEYSQMMKKRGERNGRTHKDEWLKEMYAKKDTDGDGALSYEELAKPVK